MFADGYAALREAWTAILNETEDIEVVGDVSNLEKAFCKAAECKPDVVVVDLNIPGLNNLDTIIGNLNRFEPARVILLTGFFNIILTRKVLRAGIPGYLTKFSNLEEFIKAIREVGRGGVYMEESLRDKLVYAEMLDEKDPLELLTHRELQVIEQIREGLNTREIAEQMGLSFKTIEVHRHNVYTKLRVKNRADLISFFHQRGL